METDIAERLSRHSKKFKMAKNITRWANISSPTPVHRCAKADMQRTAQGVTLLEYQSRGLPNPMNPARIPLRAFIVILFASGLVLAALPFAVVLLLCWPLCRNHAVGGNRVMARLFVWFDRLCSYSIGYSATSLTAPRITTIGISR
jgi:hypothetical protein